MDNKHFSLDVNRSNRLTRVFQLLFGIVCLVVAVFWLVFNIRTMKTEITLWITIIFLAGFGYYQIMAGLGRAAKFIEIGRDKIRLKKSSLLPPVELSAGNIEKIDVFTLSIIFHLNAGKSVILRLGTTFTDRIGPIKDHILKFSEVNGISAELKNDLP
ncbi:MAG: hypothetical protein K0B05_10010 [Bacteroidales bacterium]|nr:hypothetical protein [Bacteroidales bacterium]